MQKNRKRRQTYREKRKRLSEGRKEENEVISVIRVTQ